MPQEMAQEASRSYLTKQGHTQEVSFSVVGYPKGGKHGTIAGDVVVQLSDGERHPVVFLSPSEAVAWADALLAAAKSASQ